MNSNFYKIYEIFQQLHNDNMTGIKHDHKYECNMARNIINCCAEIITGDNLTLFNIMDGIDGLAFSIKEKTQDAESCVLNAEYLKNDAGALDKLATKLHNIIQED